MRAVRVPDRDAAVPWGTAWSGRSPATSTRSHRGHRRCGAGISTQMDHVIACGMAKDPDRRFATTKDLATAARAALSAPVQPGQPAPPSAPAWAAAVPHPATNPTAYAASAHTQHAAPPGPPSWSAPPTTNGQPPQRWWRNPAVVIVAALLAVIVIAAAVIVVVVWPQGDRSQVATNETSGQRFSPTSDANASGRTRNRRNRPRVRPPRPPPRRDPASSRPPTV